MPRRAKYDEDGLDGLSKQQHRCLSLTQLTELGVPSATVAYRTHPIHGRWQRILPGVVLLHRGQPTPSEKAAAALIYCREDSILTGAFSLKLQRVRDVPVTGAVETLVPIERRRQSVRFVVVERTQTLPDPVEIDGLLCAPLARSLVDHCRRMHDVDTVRAQVAHVVQSRRCSAAVIAEVISQSQRRGSAAIRMVMGEIIAGVRSVVEAKARALIRGAGLPEPEWNLDLLDQNGRFIAAPDGWYDELGIALEVNSRKWHLDPDSWEATQRRWALMARLGIIVIPITPERLEKDPAGVLRDIAEALISAAGRPRPRVIAVRRSQVA